RRRLPQLDAHPGPRAGARRRAVAPEAARAGAERAQAATDECDAAGQRQGRLEAEVARLHGLAAELAGIPEEDEAPIERALEAARSQLFAAGHRSETLSGQVEDLASRLADLERGVPAFRRR